MEITREVEWFLKTLRETFDVPMKGKAAVVEAVELGLDEVDDFLLPIEVIDVLPETLLYEIMFHDDDNPNEWLGVIAYHPNSSEWCLQDIMKNGELVFRKPLQSPIEKS